MVVVLITPDYLVFDSTKWGNFGSCVHALRFRDMVSWASCSQTKRNIHHHIGAKRSLWFCTLINCLNYIFIFDWLVLKKWILRLYSFSQMDFSGSPLWSTLMLRFFLNTIKTWVLPEGVTVHLPWIRRTLFRLSTVFKTPLHVCSHDTSALEYSFAFVVYSHHSAAEGNRGSERWSALTHAGGVRQSQEGNPVLVVKPEHLPLSHVVSPYYTWSSSWPRHQHGRMRHFWAPS